MGVPLCPPTLITLQLLESGGTSSDFKRTSEPAFKDVRFGVELNFLCSPLLSEQSARPLDSPLGVRPPDPMLSGSVAVPEQDLLMYLSDPDQFDSACLRREEGLSDSYFQELCCLPPLCENVLSLDQSHGLV